MEVGAVKQAFNNEVILLKKKLNQCKTQLIHKLTRKAKQLTEKKAPEQLKEKLKRKAELAVKEVLIMKKIKPKDLAKFIVTHKGNLNEHLNKPQVDNDRVCARLLLHKVLQEKYKFIRGRFSNVPIEDLFMSRLERRKMKKEAKEKQKNKKKGKDNKVVNSEGDWDVEDVGVPNIKTKIDDDQEMSNDEIDDSANESIGDDKESGDGSDHSNSEHVSNNDESEEDGTASESEGDKSNFTPKNNIQIDNKRNKLSSESENDKVSTQVIKAIDKPTPEIGNKKMNAKKKNPEKKLKEVNKNKIFNDKIQQKRSKKELEEPIVENKIVDPFFITATGENYMSVVEPRAPDEIKEEHRQGNRKIRRAAVFGHVPNIRPRKDNYRENNDRFRNGFDKGNNNNFRQRNDNFRGEADNFRNNKFNNKQDFDNRKQFNNDNRRGFNNKNDFNNRQVEKEEKLHPSWEAKKKKSGILPFEGKKIVFDES